MLTVPETARYLGVCRATVHNLIRRGAIQSVKLGKCRRIPTEGLRELHRTQTQTPAVA
jgi:excisionase family DNA binding protein